MAKQPASTAAPAFPGRWSGTRIARTGGMPCVTRDGKPWFGWAAQRPYLGDQIEVFARLTGAGFRHVHIDATCAEDLYHPELRFWTGPGRYDPSAQDAYMKAIAARIPDDALFTLRIACYAPPWWTDAHPGELQVYADGSTVWDLQARGPCAVPSLASARWRAELTAALRAYIEWLEASGWSRRVSALFLCAGITWEWAILGSDGLPDYSPHAQRYFRDWLRATYRDDAALSAAWGRSCRIEDAAIPAGERRRRAGGPHGLRIRPDEQDVIDHQRCLSDMNVDLLLALAATARDATRGEVPIGTFYGYTLTAREQTPFTGRYGAGGFVGGHHAFGRVLRSPDLDFIGSPFNYADRELGTGLILEHVPLASVHAHGKAFFDENDLYTHSGAPEGDTRVGGGISVGCARSPEESLLYLRLCFMQSLVRGKHQWLTELSGWLGRFKENFSDPGVLAEIARLQQLAEPLVRLDRSPVCEVAYVLDERSVAELTLDNQDFRDRVYQASVGWGHTGAPFDLLLLDDLLEAGHETYRLIVPACLHAPESIERFKVWRERCPDATVVGDATRGAWPPGREELVAAMARAGVHRYVDEASTVWANRSMLGIHVAAAGERTIRFRGAFRGREAFSGTPVAAPGASLRWTFGENDVALFVAEPAGSGETAPIRPQPRS